jgi:hypothetical protein
VKNLSSLLLEAKCLDGSGELLCGDVAAFIVVKDVEALLETDDVVGRQVFGDVDCGIEGGWLLGQGRDLSGGDCTDRRGDFEDI